MDRAKFCKTPDHVALFYLDMDFDPLEAEAMAENWSHRVKDKDPYAKPFQCVECGKEDNFNTAVGCHHGVIMAAENVCFNCAFWLLYCRIPHPQATIVNGKHYVCYPKEENEKSGYSRWRGFGGDTFCVLYHDGRLVTSYDTWHQGEIPERFRHILKDNARFITRAGIEQLKAHPVSQ